MPWDTVSHLGSRRQPAREALASRNAALAYFLEHSQYESGVATFLWYAGVAAVEQLSSLARRGAPLYDWTTQLFFKGELQPLKAPPDLSVFPDRTAAVLRRFADVAVDLGRIRSARTKSGNRRPHRVTHPRRKNIDALGSPHLAMAAAVTIQALDSGVPKPRASELMFLAVGLGVDPPVGDDPNEYQARLKRWSDRLKGEKLGAATAGLHAGMKKMRRKAPP